MKTVMKEGITRIIPSDRLKEYLAAGWQQEGQKIVTLDQTVQLRPPAKSKGAAKSLDNDISTGD